MSRVSETTVLSCGKQDSTIQTKIDAEQQSKTELSAVSTQEQEHEWRELLQKQLAEHWLNLYYPEETKPDKELVLAKIRGSGGKVA